MSDIDKAWLEYWGDEPANDKAFSFTSHNIYNAFIAGYHAAQPIEPIE